MRIPHNKGKYTPNKIRMYKNHAGVELCDRKGKVVAIGLIDKDDIKKISKYRWCRHISRGTKPYVTNGSYKFSIHNIIMGGKFIDHINRNGLDNRKSNLRFATATEQNINKGLQKNNKSGTKGVHFHPKRVNGKTYPYWEAYIAKNNKKIYLGCFLNKKDAILCRKNAEEKLYGTI